MPGGVRPVLRWAAILAGIVVGVWLVAAVGMLWLERGLPGRGEGRFRSPESRIDQGAFFQPSYEYVPGKSRPVAYWQGGGARFGSGSEPIDWDTADGYEYRVRRGPVDRSSATFPLYARYRVPRLGALSRVTLAVNPRPDARLDDDDWVEVAQGRIEDADGWCVSHFDTIDVPAGSGAVRFEEVRHGEQPWRTSFSLPEAPDWLGRAYDHVASWPIFRFLPDLR